MSVGRCDASVSVIDITSPLSRRTRSAQHSRHRRGGGARGGGTTSCRPGDGTRTVSRSTARPPSPARPAPPNTADTVAGEGPGVGEHQVVVPVMTCERFRHRQRVPSSALRAPSPGGGRLRWRSIRWGGIAERGLTTWLLSRSLAACKTTEGCGRSSPPAWVADPVLLIPRPLVDYLFRSRPASQSRSADSQR